ncbi:MAG TPA: GntR family transcriptional regulator [Ilumatobacter sp.]|jgi:DNA-binding GntR family transcriptional regulator|nr:GntR family transcriptional regulator [Ilumatobacter sp.]
MRRANDDPRHRLSGPGAPTSKADHAYETILRSILDGEYEPGERLVIERLARELGVSVVPVREAIRRLEADGYVTFTRNVGATVTAIDLDRYPETIEAVAAIEGVALGLAAPHLTATDLRRAREVNDRLRESLARFDPTQFTRLNRRFHEILYGACPNRHILSILEREWALLDTTRRSAFTYIPERAARSVEEHDQLLAMIERGSNAAEIELFARDHRMSTARRLLQHLGEKMELAGDSDATDVVGGGR